MDKSKMPLTPSATIHLTFSKLKLYLWFVVCQCSNGLDDSHIFRKELKV